AANVLEQHQLAAGAQHPEGLSRGPTVVGDRAEGEGDEHGVEALVVERKRLGIALVQVGLDPQVARSLAGDREHLPTELDSGQLGAGWIVLEVSAGADRYLQDVAPGLRGRPLAAIGEQDTLEEGDLAV